MKLPAVDRNKSGAVRIRMKQRSVDAFHQLGELLLVRRVYHKYTTGLARRKPAIVEVITIHRHQRPPQIVCETVVTDVGRAAQFVFFEHEENVPVQAMPHVIHQAGRNVRVCVDSRMGRETFGMRRKLRRQRPHGENSLTS